MFITTNFGMNCLFINQLFSMKMVGALYSTTMCESKVIGFCFHAGIDRIKSLRKSGFLTLFWL